MIVLAHKGFAFRKHIKGRRFFPSLLRRKKKSHVRASAFGLLVVRSGPLRDGMMMLAKIR